MSKTQIKKEFEKYYNRLSRGQKESMLSLMKSIAEEVIPELPADYRKTIDERLKKYKTNPENVIAWSDVQKKYGRK